jgi:hypothetical protein
MSVSIKQLLLKKVESKEASYNPEVQLLKTPFSSPGYHTTLKGIEFAHRTFNSLIYALALLDTEEVRYEQRSFDIIKKVISLQDTDRSSSTFGIWSWFYEEPLDRMSPPDWNWADFCGKELILIISRHGNRLPEELYAAVQQAIYHACDAIIKRNVGPNYTNIAIMGAFVTLIAGEIFERREYADYGLNRLKKLYNYTSERKIFQEYNSPPYTAIAILELSRIQTETGNEDAKRMCCELLDWTWKTLAEHYHVRTQQWSGPHARCYETLQTDRNKAMIQLATDGQVMFFPWQDLPYNEEWFGSGIRCPEKYVSYFTVAAEREIKQLYHKIEQTGLEKWATTYITPEYSLGSFSRDSMWNQTRPLLAYMDNAGEAAYLQLRCLHDGYDYCSAMFHGIQDGGHVLFGIGFMQNGGDTHPGLDLVKDATIEASDFRLRFELGGFLDGVNITPDKDGADIRIGNIRIMLKTWLAAFYNEGEEETSRVWEVTDLDGKLGLDLVLYSGEKQAIDFSKLKQAAIVCSLFVNQEFCEFNPQLEQTGDRIQAQGVWNGKSMQLSLPLKPFDV